MKKLLFLLLLFPVISFAGITDSIGTKVSNAITKVDTSSTTKMIYNDVKDAVKSIASGLKTSVEHVMTVVAKKYFIQGVFDLIISVICFVIILYLFKVVKSLFNQASEKEKNNRNADVSTEMVPCCFLTFLILGLGIFTYGKLHEGLLYTLNPEYYVIEDIFNFIKDNYKR